MGVKGYQRYLFNQNIFIIYQKLDYSWLDKCKKRNLYLDGPSFWNWIYGTLGQKTIFPKYRHFIAVLQRFDNACKSREIKLFLILDGMHRYDLDEWIKRRRSSLKTLLRAVNGGSFGNLKIMGVNEIVEMYLDCTVIRSIRDADTQLINLAKNDNLLGGIFSSDSDFALCSLNCWWFSCHEKWIKGIQLSDIPYYNDSFICGILCAYGQHECTPMKLRNMVSQYFKSYDEIFNYDYDRFDAEFKNKFSNLYTNIFSMDVSIKNIPNSIINSFKNSNLPTRVLEIIEYHQDFVGCIWDKEDILWSIPICSRWYSFFVTQPVILRSHIVSSGEYFKLPIIPTRNNFGSRDQILYYKNKRFMKNVISWILNFKVRGSLKTVWFTWLDKIQYGGKSGLSKMGINCIFYTMIVCIYNLNVKDLRKGSKPPIDLYPLVHRWIKHIQFIYMINKLFPVWKGISPPVPNYFDGDVFECIWYTLETKGFDAINDIINSKEDAKRVTSSMINSLNFINGYFIN